MRQKEQEKLEDMKLERKIKDDMADLHRQYIEEKDKAMNKKSANVAG